MHAPLADLKVIDLSRGPAGSIASQILGDYGAEVVYVEPPGGSPLRHGKSWPFWGRGKKSLVLDPNDASELDLLRNLIADADILVDTFAPAESRRLGLGYATLARRNPRLVHASVTGFGSLGPFADYPGHEGLVMAKLGVPTTFSRMGGASRPVHVSTPYCSFSAAHLALHGILSALYERETSGLGQFVETSLMQGFASLDVWEWYRQMIVARYPEAFISEDPFTDDGTPNSPMVYLLLVAITKDGRWMQFAQTSPRLFAALMKELGLQRLFTDPEWAGFPNCEDPDKRTAAWELMLHAVRERTADEWQEAFARNPDVYAETYAAGAEVLRHPQLLHDQCFVTVEDPAHGPVPQPGPFVRLDNSPATVPAPAPTLDQHRDELRTRAADPRPSVADPNADSQPRTVPPRHLPLDGVTVLELAPMFAGPYASTLLSELGARVIKVEPTEGDHIRNLQPFPEMGGGKVMQGKESIAVDITKPEGAEIVRRIAAGADVVLQSYRAGVAERLGLDAASLHAVNPDLVYLDAMGYGVDGPCGDRPAYAPSISAAAGIARLNFGSGLLRSGSELTTAEVRETSIRLWTAALRGNAQADGLAAVAAATAMLLGLYARARGRGGEHMVTSMLVSAVHALPQSFLETTGTGADGVADTVDAGLYGLGPLYRLYQASEGWVFLAAPSQDEWRALLAALDDADVPESRQLASDERFATVEARGENADALAGALAEVFAARPAAWWEARLTPSGVGCVEVWTDAPENLLMSEVGRASGMTVDVVHPTFEEHPRLAPLVRFSRSLTTAGPGCLAGQHTDRVLAELGYSPARRSDLRARGVVA